MKVGDLVEFRYCEQQGQLGVISIVCERSYVALKDPKLALYWVVYEKGHQCFTGNQLVKI